MSDFSKEKAQQLLDAQTAFWLNDLNPSRLEPLVRQELEFIYEKLDTITLRQSVDEDKVKATAQRYATEMEIAGAIPELFGEIANIIYEHPHNDTTLIGDIVSDYVATELLEKIFERKSLLDHAVSNIRESQPFQAFISDLVFTAAKNYLFETNQLMKVQPLSSGITRLRQWFQDKAPAMSENMSGLGKQLSQNSVTNSIRLVQNTLDNDLYRDSALNSTLALWDDLKAWPISYFKKYFTETDLQELLVMGYEFWLDLRHTDFMKSLIDSGVQFFFDKYGEESLQSITGEMGVTEDMIISEILNYAPDLAQLAVKEGIAETIIRRHLQRFYFDQKTLTLLQPET